MDIICYFGNGAPTAIPHWCPSCPCGGFIPGAVVVVVPFGFNIAGVAMAAPAGVLVEVWFGVIVVLV